MSAPEGAAGPAAQPSSGGPAAGSPPPRPPTAGWATLASVIKAVLTGGRREDKNARLMAALLAVIGILGGVVVRGDARTDRLIEAGEARTTRIVEALERATEATRDATEESKAMRRDLIAKIPDVKPQPRPLRTAPVKHETYRQVKPVPIPEPSK